MTSVADIGTRLEHAVLLHQTGRTGEAEAIYDAVLAETPDNCDALNLKGIVLADAGRHTEALALFDRAILAHPAVIDPYFNRGLSLAALGQIDEAITSYAQVLALHPAHADAYFNTGLLLHTAGRADDALATFRLMSENCPLDSRGFYNLAACLLQAGLDADALDAATRACALKPDWPEAHGMCAEAAFRIDRHDEAYDHAQRALTLNERLASAHLVMANVLLRREQYETARIHYQRALSENPADAVAQGNHAVLLERMGLYAEAAEAYRAALRLQPDNSALNLGLALALLIDGRFDEGWRLYAWRRSWKAKQAVVDQTLLSRMPAPGEPAIAVLDHGVGDQVLIASMIPDIQTRTSDFEVQCNPRLHALMRRSFPNVRFTEPVMTTMPGAMPAPGSFGLVDAARWLRPSFAAFPRRNGYLKPDTDLVRTLRDDYSKNSPGLLVGIAWSTRQAVKFAAHKSLPLAAWGPVLSVAGVTFVNLQYESDPAEVAQASHRFGATIISDPRIDPTKDLDPYAAQVAAMDLVITTSNTAAHLAGALNVPTWVFAPRGWGAQWHWFLDREDSPWYPSVRLFRQSRRGDWSDVVERAQAALSAFVDTWGKNRI